MGRKRTRTQTFTERKDGRIAKTFTFEGKRYYVYGSSVEDCEEAVRNKKEELKLGLLQGREKLTLDSYFEEICKRKEAVVKPATLYTDRRRYKKISNVLGRKKVVNIDKRDVYALQATLHKSLSSKGVNDTISLLKSIMNSAVNEEIIIRNPCNGIKPIPRTEDEKNDTGEKHRFLSTDEIQIFFKYAEESSYFNLFRFMLLTGVRCGEACALTWGDIDESKGRIHITKTVTREDDSHYSIGTPKTQDSKRDVELTQELRAILKEQRSQQVALFGFSAGVKDALIFTTTKGGIITQCIISPIIRNICDRATKAGEPLERFTSHSFRHTFVSYQHAHGVPLAVIARQVGHTDTITLQKHYLHENHEDLVDAFHMISEGMGKVIGM